MSITSLTVGVLGLLTENAEFQLLCSLRLLSKCHQTSLWISVPLQGPLPAHCRQEGQLGKWAEPFLPQCEAELDSWISHCIPEFQQFLLAQVIRLTASLSGVSKPLFSWMYPVSRDIWTEKSSQTLHFTEIWNYLSWNEANLDNSIPTLHRKMPCPSPHICSMGSSTGQCLTNLSCLAYLTTPVPANQQEQSRYS